jgi:hypothetical protein
VQLAPHALGEELLPARAAGHDVLAPSILLQRRIGAEELAVHVEREQADRHRLVGVFEFGLGFDPRSVSRRICSATASAASRLDASAAVTLLTTPISSRMPSAAGDHFGQVATKVTANEAANQNATRVCDWKMMLTRPASSRTRPRPGDHPHHRQEDAYGRIALATSIGRHSHSATRSGAT